MLFGLLQPLSDGVKLLLKETILPSQSDKIFFLSAPLTIFVVNLLGWATIPFGRGNSINDMELGVIYLLAMSSISVVGIILAGWSGNSKYSLMGSLRTTAQLVSYELVIGLTILVVICTVSSYNINEIILFQKHSTIFLLPLLPLFPILFISALAETNRVPFDLVESESELVSGAFTEYSSFSFALIFLGEYYIFISQFVIFLLIFFLHGNAENLFIIYSYTFIISKNNINPWFITGFTDAEGHFSIKFSKNKNSKYNYNIGFEYGLVAKKTSHNLDLLNFINNYFNNHGSIYIEKNVYRFKIRSNEGLKLVISHFNNYPLKTVKLKNFLILEKGFNFKQDKIKLDLDHFNYLIGLKSICSSLNPELILNFPNYIKNIEIPNITIELNNFIDGNWIAGFVTGDGSFTLGMQKEKSSRFGFAFGLRFIISQDLRDEILIKKINESFNNQGYLKINYKNNLIELIFSKRILLKEIIIPFFNKYKLYGNKALDFKDFSEGVELISKKIHFKIDGFNQVKELYLGMNNYRKN